MKDILKNILKLVRECVNEHQSENGELIGIGVVLVYSKGKNLQPKKYLVTEGDISYEQIIGTATSAKDRLLSETLQRLNQIKKDETSDS